MPDSPSNHTRPGGGCSKNAERGSEYVYSAKDKSRRQLAEFLPDFFYKTDLGACRPPASDEEARAKAESCAWGLGRRVKRHIAQIERGAVVPDNERPSNATLAESIRHRKRSRLHEQGKLR